MDTAMKLQTKLRHVDIYSHWLRQKVQRQSIHIRWVPTKEMIADGLTKALTSANHKAFIEITSLEDQGERLASIKMEEDKRDALQLRGAGSAKLMGTEPMHPDTYRDGQSESS